MRQLSTVMISSSQTLNLTAPGTASTTPAAGSCAAPSGTPAPASPTCFCFPVLLQVTRPRGRVANQRKNGLGKKAPVSCAVATCRQMRPKCRIPAVLYAGIPKPLAGSYRPCTRACRGCILGVQVMTDRRARAIMLGGNRCLTEPRGPVRTDQLCVHLPGYSHVGLLFP